MEMQKIDPRFGDKLNLFKVNDINPNYCASHEKKINF